MTMTHIIFDRSYIILDTVRKILTTSPILCKISIEEDSNWESKRLL